MLWGSHPTAAIKMNDTTRPSPPSGVPGSLQKDLLTTGYAMKSTLVAVRQALQIVQGCGFSPEVQKAREILEHVQAVLDAYVKLRGVD
jgi:hypothetical protein